MNTSKKKKKILKNLFQREKEIKKNKEQEK